MSQPHPDPIITAVQSHRGTVVLRCFDDNSPAVFWLLDMTGPELERWWLARDSFWFSYPRYSEEDDRKLAAIFGEEPPPSPRPPPLPPMVLPGTFLDGKSQEIWDFWHALNESGLFYCCHIWSDEESWLLTPDGRRIYHKGFVGVRLE